MLGLSAGCSSKCSMQNSPDSNVISRARTCKAPSIFRDVSLSSSFPATTNSCPLHTGNPAVRTIVMLSKRIVEKLSAVVRFEYATHAAFTSLYDALSPQHFFTRDFVCVLSGERLCPPVRSRSTQLSSTQTRDIPESTQKLPGSKNFENSVSKSDPLSKSRNIGFWICDRILVTPQLLLHFGFDASSIRQCGGIAPGSKNAWRAGE